MESIQLPAGVRDLFAPIRLTGEAPSLIGIVDEGQFVSHLRRGRLPDGTLYNGALIVVEGARGARISDVVVQGERFRRGAAGWEDARHPLTADRASPKFPCGQRLAEPDCYARRNFAARFEADIDVRHSHSVTFENVTCRDPVRIGFAIGPKSNDVRLSRCVIERAGDYGVWIGAGVAPTDDRLPLDDRFLGFLPRGIRIEDCFVERCGAAGVYVEGRDIHLVRTRLIANCHDAPYDDEGGQLTVDYKARGLTVIDSAILAGPETVRRRPAGGEDLHGCFGVEACGSELTFVDTVIEGNSREGVQILGGSKIRFVGRTRIINNHLAQHRHPDFPARQRHGISVSTTAAFAALNAYAGDIRLDTIRCENGMSVWADGSLPNLTVDGIEVRNSDLSGPYHSGVAVGVNGSGNSLRGSNWHIENPST